MLLNRALVKKDCADSLETFKGEAIFPKSNSLSKTPYSSKKTGRKGRWDATINKIQRNANLQSSPALVDQE